ncbi:MAG: hypothetical protein KC613_12340 [Myxococcales bacterium]|nr:hypothetical protein [Myxococcales bacterium]
MERHVQRYQFRMIWRGQTFETSGRILRSPEELKLQVWMRSPEQPDILLEVLDGVDEADLWRRLHLLAGYRGVDVLEYRTERSGRDGWAPMPGGPTPVQAAPKGFQDRRDG